MRISDEESWLVMLGVVLEIGRVMNEETGPSWKLLLGSAVGCGVCTLAGVWLDRYPDLKDVAHGAYAAAFLFFPI